MVRFTVADTGIGIAKEAQGRLFEPYVQAEGDTARHYGGTGLGLAICRRLAGMMGGSIEMESEPGKGTTVALTLSMPVADPRELPSVESSSEADALVSRRLAPAVEAARAEGTLVLAVEDHPTNRTLLTRLLNLIGYAAVGAENGREALEMWATGRFAAVVTDCNMPEMDGYELARRIRAGESGGARRRTPVIACTANALAGELQRCLDAGMDDFIAKPVELQALARVMARWLPLADTPIDRSSLAEVAGGDAGVEREILIDFKDANDADMATLRDALARHDVAQVTRFAHRVKGACRTVGASALAEVCERMELAGRQNDWGGVAREQVALEREFERLNAWLVTV
jgi:CheY-like chemotaxis protein